MCATDMKSGCYGEKEKLSFLIASWLKKDWGLPKRKLKRDEELGKKYCAIIEDYVDKGYARKLMKRHLPQPRNSGFCRTI